uniref:tRNA wybutosine-synthesizing protein 3 homolog n=1 Tax=Timema monikensis TaxID=170555 RepID=A0A7R9E7G0_9NEOP|nr:unnamed protein product [Timema monikensis]
MKMTPEEFRHQKCQTLQGVDLSRKGCIDDAIKLLVEVINNRDEFVTTSSCSGRVILFCENIAEGHKKGCKWLFTSHDSVDIQELINSVDPAEGNLVFKYEPLILHIRCFTLNHAKLLHTCALEAGFRNSGITLGKHGKVMLAVRSCMGLEVPISENGELLVSHKYLEFLVRKANEKVEENQSRTERLMTCVKNAFEVNT